MSTQMSEIYDFMLPNGYSKLENLYRTGINSAGETLSTYFKENINTELSDFFFLPLSWMQNHLRYSEKTKIGFHSRVSGEIRGEFYVSFSEEAAEKLIKYSMKTIGIKRNIFLKKVEESILIKVTHMLIKGFWSNIESQMTGKWSITSPVVVTNLANSLELASKIYSPDRRLLLAVMNILKPDISGELIFLPSENSLFSFIKKLSNK